MNEVWDVDDAAACRQGKHTPGQLEIVGATHLVVFGGKGGNVCSVSSPRATSEVRHTEVRLGDPDWNEAVANAKRLQLCWNSHDTLVKQRDALLSACKAAVYELNQIRARDGVPYTSYGYKSSVNEEYFSKVIDDCFAAIALAEQEGSDGK